MVDPEGVTHPGAKSLFTGRPFKLESMLSASEMQWWDRHRIGISISKGRNWKEWKGHGSQASPKLSKAEVIAIEIDFKNHLKIGGDGKEAKS